MSEHSCFTATLFYIKNLHGQMIVPHHFLLAQVAFIINVYIIVSCKGRKVILQFAKSCRNV